MLCRTGSQVDPQSYALLLQECIFRKEFKKGRRIHVQMIIVGFVPDEYLNVKLLILYAKSGDLETANILFNKLLNKSLISWNAMISGHVQNGFDEMGLSLYERMRQSGLTPDQFTFASVFRAYASLATLEDGKRAHGVMIKSQIRENVVVNSALMDMYFKCSSLSDGHQVFDKSLNRNVITWTALISGYGQQGRFEEVLQLFHKMRREGLRPNHVTFLAVLCACSYGGLVNEGWIYFSSMMRDYGIQPRGKHYAAMVDLLGRAGKLEEAYELLQNSPCREHAVMWGALLGACRIHGNLDLLKLAAKKYFLLEHENPDKYIFLSNAFASFGLWDTVADVRGTMKELGMKKEPAYSRIEVQRELHFFFMGDKSHEESEQICQMIKQITCILKDAGYVPDLSCD
ncbi:pentatricopeptide repeat-containing protein At4g16470 [Malania oleifera]|uniref:pentatricopeptide repeat-containing protein At4g16470 n=1 Tax=Malania oleifera TaxID=397392 RepID=UPI0025AE7D99|nr:pentatricopeptide repeat-containing protein At4g16470 [Malania oleifera]